MIFLILFAPLRGGALFLVLVLGLALVLAFVEDRSNHLLARGVVRAWAPHELVEVAQRVLLGLLAHVISCGDQRGVGRSAVIFSVLFPLYVEGTSF